MKTDIKIGIALGIIVAVAAIIWFMDRTDQQDTEPVITSPVPVDKAPAEPPPVVQAPEPAAPVNEPVVQPTPQEPVSPPVVEPEPQPQPVTPAPAPVAPPPQEPPRPAKRYHVVQKGETLSGISEQYYGNGRFWKVIVDANKGVIKNPDRLTPGMKLRIPYPEEVSEINP